ncbi:MAG: hypothetical protein AABY65_10445, partial [Nitrospirota bacterium]
RDFDTGKRLKTAQDYPESGLGDSSEKGQSGIGGPAAATGRETEQLESSNVYCYYLFGCIFKSSVRSPGSTRSP